MILSNDTRLILAGAQSCPDRFIHKPANSRTEDWNTVRSTSIRWRVILVNAECRTHVLIVTRPRTSPSTLHLTFIFAFVISDRLEILPNGTFVVAYFYRFHTISGEEGLSWPVELTFDSITAGPNTSLGMLDRLNQVRRSECPWSIPWDGACHRFFGLFLHDCVSTRAYSAGIIN